MTRPRSRRIPTAPLALLALVAACTPSPSTEPMEGPWNAWLQGPGGHVAFGLDLRREGPEVWSAWLVNGEERIPVPRTTVDGDDLLLAIDHYDARIAAVLGRDDLGNPRLSGAWHKTGSGGSVTTMPFFALRDDAAGDTSMLSPPPGDAPTRFAIDFADDAQPAVGAFTYLPDGTVRGTFLTTTGDYRYLAGRCLTDGDTSRITMSCFDGAHAFVFEHLLHADGTISDGHFWSRDGYHDTYTGVADPDASLPDGFALTTFVEDADLGALSFPDLDGTPRSLDDPDFAGGARILQVFGSWCPNCHDACDALAELQAEYGERGLSIVGLAFEHSGEFERDAAQVRTYAARHGVTWPLLVAGLSDKDRAGEALPMLDAVRSYPTTIFLHGDGRVRAVYQGFSGPATGDEHERLMASFRALIEELLAETAR